MTAYSRGDVVLVGFVLSDESGRKLRPAVVLSFPGYHRARQEMIVSAITGKVERRLYGDHRPSIATGILRTIKQTMVGRRIGSLARPNLDALDGKLRRSLGL